ncbi:MAG TPA: hypothetical protein VLH84_04455 [Patescibacteria group bacterium]|nr:hypothetical protein [Patescibacteria group bacterium]
MCSWHRSERARHFDKAVESAVAIMGSTAVQQAIASSALGPDAGTQALATIEHAFLPNVHGRIVKVPRTFQYSDAVMLLPLLPQDRTAPLLLDDSTFRLGSATVQKTTDYFNKLFPDDDPAFVRRATKRHLRRSVAVAQTNPARFWAPRLSERVVGRCTGHSVTLWPGMPAVYLRPNIFFDATNKLFHGSDAKVWRAKVLGHEALHVPDCEIGVDPAVTELRGYHLDTVTGNVFGLHDAVAAQVEALRQEHATPEDPFCVGAPPTDELAKLGVLS